MTIYSIISGAIVVLSGAWLVFLAILSMRAPQKAARLLSGFASSARAHYLEQALRLIAGAGFLGFAEYMAFADAFRVFGWVLLITSALLLLVPWQWHNRFAQWVVPFAARHLKLYGLAAAALAAAIFYALLS